MSLAERSESRTVRKRCAKCGKVGYYRPRERRCKFVQTTEGPLQFRFKHRYWCYGDLAAVERKEPMTKRPQDVAAAKLKKAERLIDEKTRAMVRLVKAIHALRMKTIRYAQQASMTDEQIAGQRQKRIEDGERRRSARARRGIELTG